MKVRFGSRRLLSAVTLFSVTVVSADRLAAQVPQPLREGTGVVLGVVVAGDTGEPLPATMVEVRSALDSAVIATGATNDEGMFRIARLLPGRLYLQLTNLGYGTVTTIAFELAVEEVRNLGTLRLPVAALQLEPIQVSSERNAVTFEADRTSYNTDIMPGTQGASVTETLQTIPDLEVDINGRITLRGAAPAIYINGRRAPMSGEALTLFLEQFPTGYLQKIEVIENPSARYAAEGSGGIVNLVLKEGVELGMSGSVFANAGTRGQFGGGARGTLQRGDWTLNAGAFSNFSDTESTRYDLRQNLLTDPAFLRQDGSSERSSRSGNVDLGVRYDATEQMQLNVRGQASMSGSDAGGITTTSHLDELQELILEYGRSSLSDSRNVSFDLSAGLEQEWTRDHDLEVELQLQSGRSTSGSREEITERGDVGDGVLIPAELTLDDEEEDSRELSLNLDYSRPLGEFGDVELGVSRELEEEDAGRLIRMIEDPVAAPDGEVTDRGFDHRQVSTAAYMTLRRQFGGLGVQLGLRAEHLDMEFDVPAFETLARGYTDFFPSANVSYRFDEDRQIRMSYSRRIGRPGASVLDPTNRTTDPANRRVGNPDVEPEYTHSVTMNASWSTSFGDLRLSPYFQNTTNGWAQITTVDDQGVSTQTYRNLTSEKGYGASLSLSLRDRSGWGGNISLSGRRTIRDASNLTARYSGSSLRWSTRANLRARLTESLNADGNFSYSPPTDLPQGRSDASYRGDIGLRYRFLDNRASLRLSLRDPFGLQQSSSRLADVSWIQIGRSRESTRSAEINLSYSLGGGGRMRGGDRGGDRGDRGGDRGGPGGRGGY